MIKKKLVYYLKKNKQLNALESKSRCYHHKNSNNFFFFFQNSLYFLFSPLRNQLLELYFKEINNSFLLKHSIEYKKQKLHKERKRIGDNNRSESRRKDKTKS